MRGVLRIGVAAILLAVPRSAAAPTHPSRPPASPSDEAAGRQHFQRGLELLNIQDYDGALAEFEASYRLSHRVSVLYNIGLARQALHRYPEAVDALEQYMREAASISPARRDALNAAITEIRGFIAELTLRGVPDGARVRIDGAAAGTTPFARPIRVSAGSHRIDVSADGFDDARDVVSVAGGDRREVAFAMSPVHGVQTDATALRVSVLPAGSAATVRIDDHATALDAWQSVAEGQRTVVVAAPGWQSYVGRVRVGAGERRELRVVLHRPSTGLSPVPFVACTAAALAFGIASGVLGAIAQLDYNRFETLTRGDPRAAPLAQQGNTEVALTDIFLGVAGVAAVQGCRCTAHADKVRPGPHVVDVAIAPSPSGGAVAVSARF